MKKVILGMALFAGSFALANGSIEGNESKTPTSEVTCSCELDALGTCTITVTNGGTTTTYIYFNVSQEWCQWQAMGFAVGFN